MNLLNKVINMLNCLKNSYKVRIIVPSINLDDVSEKLYKNDPGLRSLDLGSLCDPAVKEGWAFYAEDISFNKRNLLSILKAIKNNKYIERFIFSSRKKINKNILRLLEECLKENKSIKELTICRLKIDNECIQTIVNSLNENNTIKKLFLLNLDINHIGSRILGEFIKSNKSIRTLRLDLIEDKINPQNFSYLREALKENCSINKLYLAPKVKLINDDYKMQNIHRKGLKIIMYK